MTVVYLVSELALPGGFQWVAKTEQYIDKKTLRPSTQSN